MAAMTLVLLSGVRCVHTQRLTRWQDILEQRAQWYATAEARAAADAVLLHQRPSGGWPKDIDMMLPPPDPTPPPRPDATIDNGATTTQIRLLASVGTAAGGAAPDRQRTYLDGALRGIDYLLEAQYPNGGWPQFFPLRKDYSRYITFNDNAMMNVMVLLDEVAGGKPPFAFVDTPRRHSARIAVDRGVQVILRSQIRIDGVLTAWCAQHDEVTLEPRSARSFEHASLSGNESVAIIRFLMQRQPTPEIIAAIEGAAAWLQRVRLADGRWARFYEFTSNRPIFSGRDGVVRYTLEEIEKERQDGYAWYGTWPKTLIEKQYPAWKSRGGGSEPQRVIVSFRILPLTRTFLSSIPLTFSSRSSF
jgi:PelA/Pel-15E family pectate lyase